MMVDVVAVAVGEIKAISCTLSTHTHALQVVDGHHGAIIVTDFVFACPRPQHNY